VKNFMNRQAGFATRREKSPGPFVSNLRKTALPDATRDAPVRGAEAASRETKRTLRGRENGLRREVGGPDRRATREPEKKSAG